MSEQAAPLMEHEQELDVLEKQGAGPKAIAWYRVKIDPKLLRELHERSDFKALIQSGGYLGLFLATGALSIYSCAFWAWYVTVPIVFLHGMVASFMINGVHELCHNTVFKSQWLNWFFVRVLSFFGWINFRMFEASHLRHHRYTLHAPDDLEVTLPYPWNFLNCFKYGFINRGGLYGIHGAIRAARGEFVGEWENKLFPASDRANQMLPINWARFLIFGHCVILLASIALGLLVNSAWFLLPILTTFNGFYGQWLFFLCNNTQHVGLVDQVDDFRLCCRTIWLDPISRFLYWNMNYHTEHHMYAAVPCYNLHRLHKAIKHELPPTKGLIGAWKEIAEIQRKQKADPNYKYFAPCPAPQKRERRGPAAAQEAPAGA